MDYNRKGLMFDTMYIYEQEACWSKWFMDRRDLNSTIYSDSFGPIRMLLGLNKKTAASNNDDINWSDSIFSPDKSIDNSHNGSIRESYIYIRYVNIYKNMLYISGSFSGKYILPVDISKFNRIINSKNKIYDCGGSILYN
jgi:uncharacterized membrane protein